MARSTLVRIAITLALCHLAALPAAAQSPTSGTFHLDTELYRSLHGAYGDVKVEETGAGGLHFMVSLDPAQVGDLAEVVHVFLSLGDEQDWPAGLSVLPDDPESFAMRLGHQRQGYFSMGARFGGIVSIYEKHEHPRKGSHHRYRHRSRHEGALLEVGFTLTADAPLSLDDVLAMQSTWRNDMAQIAVYSKHTRLEERYQSMGVLGGLFEADSAAPPPADPGSGDGSSDPGGGGSDPLGGVPSDGTVPPGCAGVYDSVTGELISVFCP